MELDTLVKISRLFFPVIAIAGVFIAWQQFTMNREKLRLDLYEKRYKIFDALIRYINDIIWGLDDGHEESFVEFEKVCNEAEFVLNGSTLDKVVEVREDIRYWYRVRHNIRMIKKNICKGESLEAEAKKIIAIEKSLSASREGIKNNFSRVLKFEKI